MNFRFKLYKALTGVNLTVASFFLLMSLFTALLAASLSQALVGILALGAVIIHSVLSLYLQRSLVQPELPLKPNTPGGIRIMGGIVILYAAVMLFSSVGILGNRQEVMEELLKQMPDDQQESAALIMPKVMTAIAVILLVFGATLLVNALLSFSFLKQWKQRQTNTDEL